MHTQTAQTVLKDAFVYAHLGAHAQSHTECSERNMNGHNFVGNGFFGIVWIHMHNEQYFHKNNDASKSSIGSLPRTLCIYSNPF